MHSRHCFTICCRVACNYSRDCVWSPSSPGALSGTPTRLPLRSSRSFAFLTIVVAQLSCKRSHGGSCDVRSPCCRWLGLCCFCSPAPSVRLRSCAPQAAAFYTSVDFTCVPHRRSDKLAITTTNCRSRPALMFVLNNEDTLDAFIAFCKTQHSEENVLFWKDVRDFKALPPTDAAGLRVRATSIVSKVGLGKRPFPGAAGAELPLDCSYAHARGYTSGAWVFHRQKTAVCVVESRSMPRRFA